MEFLLTALNAKFIHSALALYSLKSYVRDENADIIIKEFSINNTVDSIVAEIYRTKINIIGFSFYIWNIERNFEIISVLKKANPDIIIIAGGPEAFGIEYNEDINIIVYGEGEKAFYQLTQHFLYKEIKLSEIEGISYRDGGKLFTNKRAEPIQLNDIPFVYDKLLNFENKIIYYETSRGCPFNCQYCMSSTIFGVRYLPLERVIEDLTVFLNNKVMQVKLVDRTFNSDYKHAYEIWRFLIDSDNGYTNFHFEIAADLLTLEQLELLKTARRGLFQFEIGVQSTNLKTLDAIKRKTNLKKLFDNVRIIKSFGNIHQHLDLIAGLPFEGFPSFRKSFNDVIVLRPEQLQLGFLKVLKETGLHEKKDEFNFVFTKNAPYEIISTNWISFDEILDLKMVEEVVELFYNSSRFENSLKYIYGFFDTPFDFFYELGQYWMKNGLNLSKHNKFFMDTTLFKFGMSVDGINIGLFKDLIKYDMLLHENLKKLPDLFLSHISEQEKSRMFSFLKKYSSEFFETESNLRQVLKNCNLEKFNFDVLDSHEQKTRYILFCYGREKTVFDVTMQIL